MAASTPRSIGQVLSVLKGDFPDISISKIRFLESEGLLQPERAPSGYRRYAEHDVARLRYILRMQRDHYLPLRVIREHLEVIDAGGQPPVPGPPAPAADGPGTEPAAAADPVAPAASAVSAPRLPPADPGPAAGSTGVDRSAVRKPPVRLTRADLLRASGLTEAALTELERIQVVQPKRGTHHYGREALAVAVAAKRLAVYGIDSRHLRAFKMAADREIGLVEQAIAPHVRRAKGGPDVTAEVTQLIISVHAALLRIGMTP